MKIVCPSCNSENKFDLTAKIECINCKEDISTHTYKKPILSGVAILAIGVFGGQFIDYTISDNHYPLNVEYALMKSCVNSYSRYISKSKYEEKEKLCLCALEGAMNEISYVRLKIEEKDFSKSFRENIEVCRE